MSQVKKVVYVYNGIRKCRHKYEYDIIDLEVSEVVS